MLAVDLRSTLDQAEKAVAREDYVAAERLLRDALSLQEGNARGEEIAKTLNNLAIVSEMAGKVADAESFYRRAYEIARASLPATDPFVTTSRENLEEFCRDRGLPVTRPQAPPPAPPAPPPTPPAAASAGHAVPSPPPKTAGFIPQTPKAPAAPPPPSKAPSVPPPTTASPTEALPTAPPTTAAPTTAASVTAATPPVAPATPPRASARPTPPPVGPPVARPPAPPQSRIASPVSAHRAPRGRALFYGLLTLAIIAAAVFIVERDSSSRRATIQQTQSEISTSPTPAPSAPANPSVEPTPPVSQTPAPEPEPAPPQPQPEKIAPPPPAPVAETPKPPPPAIPARNASVGLNVVSAELCRSLSTTGAWRCTPATDPQAPTTLTFFTRVAAPRDTSIEHRWYRGDSLQQRVSLRIRPNPSGYRTYSRATIRPDAKGNWRVELRSQDGQVLDTKMFAVN